MTHAPSLSGRDRPAPALAASPVPARPSAPETTPSALSLAAYLAMVGAAVQAGLPQRSWIEATIVAVKRGPSGHSLQLVDPAGGAAPAQMRAFLGTTDRITIERKFGTTFDPLLLVGMTAVLQVEPEFHQKWHLSGRVVGLSEGARDSLLRRAVEEIRARLRRDGLYGRQRSLPTPADVLRVAVIHPAGAAGWADIAAELERWKRAGIIAVTSVPAAFEGPGAALGLVAALDRAATSDIAPPDLVLMVRGGGDRAGLMALDDERVARAVCRCRVPVITGLGHAIDRSLLDEVAWAACDTPSKALAHVASLIAEPARRARADMATIAVEADRLTGGASHALDLARHRALGEAERRLAAAISAVAAAWATARAGIAGAVERCGRLDDGARRLLGAVLDLAPLRLEAAARVAQHRRDDTLDGIGRRVGRADDGAALIARIVAQAQALVEASNIDLARRIDGALLDAGRGHAGVALDLDRLMSLADSLGLDATLARGFALALAPDGTLVPTRATALAARTLTLWFSDGVVATRVEPHLTATIGDAA